MSSAPSSRSRPPARRRWPAPAGLWLVLVALTACTAGTATSTSTGASDPVSTRGNQMTNTASQELVRWDLSSARTPGELGGRSDDVVSAETLGRNGVDTRIVLPGGDTVAGSFGLVTADSGGGGGPVRYLSLATTQLHDGDWDSYVDGFVDEFGGDRAAVTAYLDAALPAMAAGQVDPGRHFAGQDRAGYRPSLQVRPARDGVVVAWKFTLDQ